MSKPGSAGWMLGLCTSKTIGRLVNGERVWVEDSYVCLDVEQNQDDWRGSDGRFDLGLEVGLEGRLGVGSEARSETQPLLLWRN
jgi:hypothetical protein